MDAASRRYIQVASTIPLVKMSPPYTMLHAFENSVSRYPDNLAIAEAHGPRVTYREFFAQSVSVSHLLLAVTGFAKGDRVAIYLPRSIVSAVALFGVWLAGGEIAVRKVRQWEVEADMYLWNSSTINAVATGTGGPVELLPRFPVLRRGHRALEWDRKSCLDDVDDGDDCQAGQ